MPDEALYDPDRSVPEDLDFTDPEVAHAYLDHPVSEKLANDVGRAFRTMPASHQQRELSEFLSQREEQRAQVAANMDNLDRDAPRRPGMQQLLESSTSRSRRRNCGCSNSTKGSGAQLLE